MFVQMSTAKRLHYTYQEYLQALEDSSIKLEYCDGVIYAMAGGTLAHAELSANIVAILKGAVKNRCHVLSSDAKVRVEASDLSTFPDASVVCGDRQVSPVDAHALTNPGLLVEVTSRSTEDYDRGDKLSQYKQIPSLRVVLFVSHRTRALTLIQRTGEAWEEREIRSGEQVSVPNLGITFALDDVYAGVTLDPS
jgi:Uma2 family endonuclease